MFRGKRESNFRERAHESVPEDDGSMMLIDWEREQDEPRMRNPRTCEVVTYRSPRLMAEDERIDVAGILADRQEGRRIRARWYGCGEGAMWVPW